MSVLNQIGATFANLLTRTELLSTNVYMEQINGTPIRVQKIHAPIHAPDTRPPLLIGLHGYGSDQRQIDTLVNVQLNGPYIYIAPRAPHAHPTGGFAWFPIDTTNGQINFRVEELQQSLDLVAALILRALERYDADPERVFLVGYSQGQR